MLILDGKRRGLTSVAFSPDGSRLAARTNDGAVRVWALPEGRLEWALATWGWSSGPIFFLAPDTVGVQDRYLVRPYSAGARLPDREFRLPGGRMIWEALASPDGGRLCLADEFRLHCFDVQTRQQLWAKNACPRRDQVSALAWSADGRLVLAGGLRGHVRLLDGSRGEALAVLAADHSVAVRSAAVSSTGGAAWCAATHLRIRLPDGSTVHNRLGRTHFHGVAFHRSGEFLATANGDGKVDYWDARTGERRQSFDWGLGKLHAVAFDPVGDRAACCSESGKVVIWDVDR